MGKRRGKRPPPDPSKHPKTEFVLVKANPVLEEYYRLQLALSPEDHASLFDTMREQLPVTFRVNNTLQNYQTLISKLTDPSFLQSLGLADCGSLQLKPIEWCPGQVIWQLNSNRSDLKRSPAVKALHEFLQKATDCWLISRQELVSMLPPLMLDVHPGQKVLDMCAAPGSKTAQIIEMLEDTGLIVANDVDINRAFMMIHQLHRSNTTSLLVTNHPAQQFPNIGCRAEKLMFDRVLCDVPCSGDGTIRKTPNKWKIWNVRDAVNVHSLQLQIALRGLALTQNGGLLLYSTCSLNPIEDESVVNAILKTVGAGVELEDLPAIIATKYPGLRFRPGLETWKVLGNAPHPSENPFVEYRSEADFPPKGKYKATMLPGEGNPELRKCVRILPQDQNSGGFFLALIRKKAPIEIESEEVQTTVAPKIPTNPKRKVHKGISEYIVLGEDSEEYRGIAEYYGFAPAFPVGSLYTPSEVHKKNIYFISESIRSLLRTDTRKSIRVINMGVKAFSINKERVSTPDCKYRICQDAVPFLFSFLTKRKCHSTNRADFNQLITRRFLKLEAVIDASLRAQLEPTNGYFVVHFQRDDLDEKLVILKHADARLVLMISEELIQGLKIRYEIPPAHPPPSE